MGDESLEEGEGGGGRRREGEGTRGFNRFPWHLRIQKGKGKARNPNEFSEIETMRDKERFKSFQTY